MEVGGEKPESQTASSIIFYDFQVERDLILITCREGAAEREGQKKQDGGEKGADSKENMMKQLR